MTKTPGPARGLLTAGIALADTKPMQAPTDPAGESISRRACGAGSRSTLIVPRRAGNRGHRDPLEGRGVSPGQNRGRDTWGNSGFHNRVNATAADSRAGVKSFGLPPAALGPVPSANLPGEEPDALVRARPALRGGELGNDSPYSAPCSAYWRNSIPRCMSRHLKNLKKKTSGSLLRLLLFLYGVLLLDPMAVQST